MPTQAIAATGIVVNHGSNLIPELVNLSDLGGQFTLVEVSAHDGNGWAARIPTLLDGGTVRLVCNFIPGNAVQAGLRAAMLARSSEAFAVGFPPANNPIWTFNAFISNYRVPAAPVNGALQLNIDLTIDGPITMA